MSRVWMNIAESTTLCETNLPGSFATVDCGLCRNSGVEHPQLQLEWEYQHINPSAGSWILITKLHGFTDNEPLQASRGHRKKPRG